MDYAELRKLCEETPPGPWGYYGDEVVGLTADCKCPEEPLLNEHAGIGYYVSGPPHECHEIIPGRFADDIECGTLSFEQYIRILKFCAAARTAVPALLDELERVYAVMEADTRAIYWLSNGIDIRNYHYRLGDCPWIVSKNGWPDGVTKNPNEINLACGSCHGKGMPLYKDGPTIPCSGCWIDHEQESFKKAIRYPTIQAALARAWELERGT